MDEGEETKASDDKLMMMIWFNVHLPTDILINNDNSYLFLYVYIFFSFL